MGIEALKKDSIIIFISGLNLHKTPKPVQEAIASDEAAGPTPIIAVFDDRVEKQIGVVPYFDMKDVNGFASVRKALGDHLGVAFEQSTITYQPETWKDQRGRSIEAAYVTSTSDLVTLKLSNGKLSTIAISKLNDQGQKRVAELAAN